MILVDHLREQMIHRYLAGIMRPLAEVLTNDIRTNMRAHTPEDIQDFLKDFQREPLIIQVQIMKPSGEIVFASDTNSIGKIDSFFLNKGVPDLQTDRVKIYKSNNQDRVTIVREIEQLPECQSCHTNSSKIIGVMQVTLDNSIEGEIERILRAFDFGSFIFFLILIGGVIFAVHQFFFQRPFHEIQRAVTEIEKGHLETRVKVQTSGEMKRLADKINSMAARLQQARDELNIIHRREIHRASQLAAVGELAASLAHEIRNPIAGIRNALEIMVEKNRDLLEGPIVREIFNQIDRIVKTINDLLTFAMPREPRFQKSDLAQVLQESVALYQQQFQRHGVKVELDLHPCPLIEMDPGLIKQVLVNLLINAYQACLGRAGAKIVVRLQPGPTGEECEVQVVDNGPGIPLDRLEKIFKPFFTTKHKGTGLGLSLCRSIVAQHGGQIWAENSPDGGAQLCIRLPLTQTEK